MKSLRKFTQKQKIAAVLLSLSVTLTPALSFTSRSILSEAYAVAAYFTSGNVSTTLGASGTIIQAGGGIALSLGLICPPQAAAIIGFGA